MFGAIEILMIAIIFGIIYGRDAIDRTWNKSPDEGTMESFAADVQKYYKKDPKRLIQIVVGVGSLIIFIILLIYWVLTRTDILKMIGLDQ